MEVAITVTENRDPCKGQKSRVRQYNGVDEPPKVDIDSIMDLRFEIGESQAPVGHSLIYFTAADGRVLATYVLVLPISVNLEKYVPPAFASLMPTGQVDMQAATPMPPVAEEIESVDWLRSLAAGRHDDLINAGMLYSTDVQNVMQMTQEAAAEYAQLYKDRIPNESVQMPSSAGRYADLTDAEKLNELTRLMGRLRDTLGTPESEPVQTEVRELASTIPSKYRVDELLECVLQPGGRGQELATLHLQRSYKILNEEYLEVADIERQIRELQAS